MSAFRVGTRSFVAVRYRMLLFEDRVEEVGGTPLGLEIRRLFFDEAQCATVHRTSTALEVVAGAFCALLFAAGAVLAHLGDLWLGSFLLSLLAVVAVGYAVHGVVRPAYVLVLRTADQHLETRLPRDSGRRAEVVGRVARTIERYQAQHAPPGSAAPPAEPPAEPPVAPPAGEGPPPPPA
jgi:hypothetical protein